MHVRQVKWLLDAQVRRPRHLPHLLQQGIRIGSVALQIGADDLNINRRGQTEIQNLADHIGRQESKGHAWKLFSQADPKIVDIAGRLMVVLGEAYQDVGIGSADRRRIAVGEVNPAVGQSDIVDDAGNLAGWKLLFDESFNHIAETRRLLNACSLMSAKVERERPTVHGREKVRSQPRNNDRQRNGTGCVEPDEEDSAGMQSKFRHHVITIRIAYTSP